MSSLSEADLAAIHELGRRADELAVNGNWPEGHHMIADDFRFVVPEAPPIEGKAAWLEFVTQLGPMPEANTVIDEVEGHGDLAYVWGHQNFAMETEGGLHRNTSRFLAVCRKNADGAWQWSREAVTFDEPFSL